MARHPHHPSHRCPASRIWQVFGLGKVGYRGVCQAEVDLTGTVPGQVFVRPDFVELDPEGFGLADQVEGVVDLFAVQPLVLQRSEGSLSHAVLARGLDPGANMTQLGPLADEALEEERTERAAVVRDQRDGDDLTGVGVGQVL